MAAKRSSEETGSEISVGPIHAKGEAARMVAKFAPTLLLIFMFVGGIPAVYYQTSGIDDIKAELAEIKAAQAEHIAKSNQALALLPSRDSLEADHERLVQLRATVAACCGGFVDEDRPRRRVERFPVSTQAFDGDTALDAGAEGSAWVDEAARDAGSDADTTPVPVGPPGVAGR